MTDARSDTLAGLHRWWRAANYLSVGQIYLLDNPLLEGPLKEEDVKPRLLGHWGTTPGLNFVYAHLNRIIAERDAEILYVCGPGHGGPGMVANTWLEGSYSETYPEISLDREGMRRLFRQFSFPGGVPSHVAPETPGSIHEGGELGYALVHAFGAAFDNPDLTVACVVGDGEAETGPLAGSWHSNKFLNPAIDGAVLPILHLNGYKIANPTILARMDRGELEQLFRGHGYDPIFVEGSDPMPMHRQMADALDRAFDTIEAIRCEARSGGPVHRPVWPMIILRSPKGWTGPAEVDGKKVEDFWRSHQVPVSNARGDEAHRKILEEWMRSYDPADLFEADGRPKADILALSPKGERRMGAIPHANGGLLRVELKRPDPAEFAIEVPEPGAASGEATRALGRYLKGVMSLNEETRNFLVFGPDETASNRLDALFDVTTRRWLDRREDYDVSLGPDGRVFEALSEHLCQGWLEGYLLTGRHGFFSCYEAFIHIVDSMFNQHAKWLKVSREIEWRKPVASLNYLLTSHVWQQDHNGFSHQDPGFVDHVANKKADVVRVYFPPDANTLLWVGHHVLGTWDRVNVIVAGKAPAPQWLGIEAAKRHVEAGIGAFDFASNPDADGSVDLVLACAGDVPTLEAVAASAILREGLPDLRLRLVNVVDLMALDTPAHHPHGMEDEAFDALFTGDKPVIFAYHGYAPLIHRLTYKRTNHDNIHVHGYREEGTTTTPFDMTVLNEVDRFHLSLAALDRLPQFGEAGARLRAALEEKLREHSAYIREHGRDMPEIREWSWPFETAAEVSQD